MSGTYIVEQLINGICQGSIYALTAIGYAIIVGIIGVVNFAYGDVVMLGAFGAYFGSRLFGNNLLLGLLVGFVTSALIGVVVQKICVGHFVNGGGSAGGVPLLCLISMSMILKSLAQVLFGPEYKPYPSFIEQKTIQIGAIRLTLLQIIIICIVLVLCIFLSIFLKTRTGLMLRAVRLDKKAAALTGIDVSKMTSLGCFLGYGVAGMSGVLLGLYYGLLSPLMGSGNGMKAFSAAALGGMTDISASALGGVIIGIMENMGVMLISVAFRDIIAFAFLIIVLLLKPTGFKLSFRKGKKA